ncbi:hypothetical protein M758_2G037200 [Ceratodon purpureus]|nr:hypothetical protein M758_2G037200 [Ceratodon purpureus]
MASTSACVMSAVSVGSVAGAPRAQAERVASVNNVLLSGRRASSISGVALPSLARAGVRTEAKRSLTIVAAKATKEAESTVNETTAAAEDFLQSLQDAWEKSDDKPAIAGLVAAGLIGVWAAFGLVGAIEKLPLIPDIFEIVGILFSGWFVYRYLLFKPDREELLKIIDEQKAKITGQ